MKSSRNHAYIILTLLTSPPPPPPFFIVKMGSKNLDCGYSLEPPRRGGSNEYLQSMFWAEIRKNIRVFLSENSQSLEVKFSVYLNRRVFVMSAIFDRGKADAKVLFCSHWVKMAITLEAFGICSFLSHLTWYRQYTILKRWAQVCNWN